MNGVGVQFQFKSCTWIALVLSAGILVSVIQTVVFSQDTYAFDVPEEPILIIDNPHPADVGDINSLAFSPDGTKLATGGREDIVRVWDVSFLTGQPPTPTPTPAPDTGYTDFAVKVFDSSTFQVLRDASVILADPFSVVNTSVFGTALFEQVPWGHWMPRSMRTNSLSRILPVRLERRF